MCKNNKKHHEFERDLGGAEGTWKGVEREKGMKEIM